MKIGLDIRPLMNNATGVGTYWKNMLRSLSEIDETHEYYLFSASLKDSFKPDLIPSFPKQNFKHFRFPQKWLDFSWSRWKRPLLDSFFRTRLDISHSPSPLICPTLGKKIVTVHDLFFVDHPELSDRQARKRFLPGLAATLQQADAVVAVSWDVKKKIRENFSLSDAKIFVIYHGVDRDFFHPRKAASDKPILEKYGLKEGYLFFLGAMEPRKNLPVLLEAYRILSKKIPGVRMVIAGKPGRDTPVLRHKIKQYRLESQVKLLEYIPREEIPAMYRGAGLFVFPSLCEGFGLPLLEAMSCRVPVAASRAEAIPEIGKEAALYFDPRSPEDMARAVRQLLESKAARERLIKKGEQRVRFFSWRKTARLVKSLYEKTAGNND